MLLSAYPLTAFGLVVAAALYVFTALLGTTYGAVCLAVLAGAAVAVAVFVGRKYTHEQWDKQRAMLKVRKCGGGADVPAAAEPKVKFSVVAPCYNESSRIERMLRETRDYFRMREETWELIVVDDGSTDDSIVATLRIAAALGLEDVLKVLPVKPNHGKGYAVKQGVFASNGEYILMADADAATDIRGLPALETQLARRGIGIVIGSRAHMEQESQASRAAHRTVLMHLFHFCVAFTFAATDKHTPLQDTQCGFKLFKRAAALKVFSNIHLERWAFDVETLIVASKLNIDVAEVQVKWEEIDGSKMSVKGMVRMGMELLLTCICMNVGLWQVRDIAV
eukprot:TRINITY_DN12929_c0_g1_i1.p1 TRINITY_DN12929_c0_g1~~TRINITY_DN12929_c0_g1_i1.p1  ORF type:complete len:337 (+),score=111.65 TRINITY_DN12929_c0_g1_i1:36-1046(+)